MTRLDIVGSFSGHAGPRRLCERYPSSHCEVTTPPDAGYCDAGGCPLGIDKVGASDGDLVRRVLAGDTGAYAALVARYRDRLGGTPCTCSGTGRMRRRRYKTRSSGHTARWRAATIPSGSVRGFTASW